MNLGLGSRVRDLRVRTRSDLNNSLLQKIGCGFGGLGFRGLGFRVHAGSSLFRAERPSVQVLGVYGLKLRAGV